MKSKQKLEIPTPAEIRAALSRKSLAYFTNYTQHEYLQGWFNKSLCDALQAFYIDLKAGRNPRLIIEAPPQHGKSTIVSKSAPAWFFGKDPDLRIATISYASSLAERNCRDTQRIMEEEKYLSIFPETQLNFRNARTLPGMPIKNNEMFEIVGHRGFYKAVGIGGALTGTPFEIGIIDDPFKDHEEAYSALIRDKVWDWYTTVFLTRRAPMHGIIIMNTRWHDDDLCGRLQNLEGEKWTVLRYKAIATEDEKYRKKGEALHPERYPISFYKDYQDEYPVFFAAMYQQTPVPESGQLFKPEMFDFVDDLPQTFDWGFVTADTAYKDKQENDNTVFTSWGVYKNEPFIRDVWKRKINAAEIETPATTFIKQYQNYGFRGAYIEPKGHGIYLNQQLPKLGVMIPGEAVLKEFFSDRNKNKTERASNVIPYLGNKKVHIYRKINGIEDCYKELMNFPKAKHDDFVDTVIDGIKLVFTRKLSTLDVL